MVKYLIKVVFVLFLGVCIVSLLDSSSEVTFTLRGYNYKMSPIDVALYILGLFFVLEFLFAGFRAIILLIKHDVLISNHAYLETKKNTDNAPSTVDYDENNTIVLSRNQLDEVAILIVKTMAAISTGLFSDAKKHLATLKNIIGNDAVVDILMMKIYKGEKNFDKVEELSKKLMQNEDIQLVGMKAALEVQMQKKEFTEALKTVNQAFEVRQDLYWVISSAFLLRAKNNDWLGALEVLEAGIEKKLTPEHKATRLKAVALYELAKQARKEGDNVNFFKFITQALDENNKLIPAALDLADYYVKNDRQWRKAKKVLYNMWVSNPSYDVAIAYLNLFKKDTVAEKIQRMENLALVNSKNPSLNHILLAEIYCNTKKYDKADTECKIFLLKNPATQKVAEIIKTLDEKKGKKKEKTLGLIKSITQKIKHTDDEFSNYPRDFKWICANCGHTQDEWEAICPKCGEIGRSYWHLYVDNETPENDDN